MWFRHFNDNWFKSVYSFYRSWKKVGTASQNLPISHFNLFPLSYTAWETSRHWISPMMKSSQLTPAIPLTLRKRVSACKSFLFPTANCRTLIKNKKILEIWKHSFFRIGKYVSNSYVLDKKSCLISTGEVESICVDLSGRLHINTVVRMSVDKLHDLLFSDTHFIQHLFSQRHFTGQFRFKTAIL